VTLAIDAFGAGERGAAPGRFEYHGAGIGAAVFDLGETLLGLQVYDNMRGIDLLQSLDFVQADRIGVTGASGGGNQTMWLAALDPRIKAAVPVVSVGTFESYVTRCNCVCEVLPDGLTFVEEWAVLGLVAPNALLLLNSLQDMPTFCVPEMLRSFNAARRVYRLYGAEEKIACQAFDLPHGYHPEMREYMVAWFKRWLKGEGDGRPRALPEFRTLPEADCCCFSGGKRPAQVISIPEYVRGAARRLAASHLVSRGRISAAAKRRELQALLRLPPAGRAAGVEIGAEILPEFQVRKSIVESEPGIPLPVLMLTRAGKGTQSSPNGLPTPPPSKEGKFSVSKDLCHIPSREGPGVGDLSLATFTRAGGRPRSIEIFLDPAGKRAFENDAEMKARVAAGAAAILADLRGTGETRYDKNPLADQTFHDHSRACFWLGRTMLGDWTRDLLALAQWAAARLPRLSIDLVARGETGLAALAAAALGARIRKITAVNLPASYLFDGFVNGKSMAIHVPGILRWGDISMLAALAGCRLEILSPLNAQGQSCSSAQCRALTREIASLVRRLGTHTRVCVCRKPGDSLI
jgi:hypothetical protein